MKSNGFTLGELTITLIIITLVVLVTLPITLNKMKRVENDAYYMGYDTAVDIWANVSENLQPEVTYEVPDSTPGQGDGNSGESEVVYGDCYVYQCEWANSGCNEKTYKNVTEDQCTQYIDNARDSQSQCGTEGGNFTAY